MNSRKNHVKRVAAGALAVLTVAAYAAPAANVGGLPKVTLTAEAAYSPITVKEDDKALTPTTFEKGDYFEENVEFNKPSNGQAISIKIGKDTYSKVTKLVYKNKNTKGKDGDPDYVEKTHLEIYTEDAAEAVTVNLNDDKMFQVKAIGEKAGDPTFTIDQVAVAESWGLNISDFSQFITNLSYTNLNNKVVNKNADGVDGITSINIKAKTMVTVKSKVMIKGFDEFMTKDSKAGSYVYTFRMLEDKTLAAKTVNVKVTKDTLLELGKDEKLEYTITDANKSTEIAKDKNFDLVIEGNNEFKDGAYAGSTITVIGNNSFAITSGAIKEKADDPDLVGTYVGDGKYAVTFVSNGENINVNFVKHTHKLDYTLAGNKLTASCTAAEKDLIDQPAAVVAAYIPNKEGKLVDPIANNTAYYLNDVRIKVDVDATLLGTSGTTSTNATENNILYRAIIKYATDTYTLTYYAGGEYVFTDGKNLTIDSKNKDAADALEKLGLTAPTKTGFDVGGEAAGSAGTYNIELQVWGKTDVTEGAKKLKYSYTVKPSEKISEKDVMILAVPTDKATEVKEGILEGAKSLITQYNEAIDAYNLLLADSEATTEAKKAAKETADGILKTISGKSAYPVEKKDGVYNVVIPAEAKDAVKKDGVTLIFLLKDNSAEVETGMGKFYILKDSALATGDYALSGSSYTFAMDAASTMEYSIINPNYKNSKFNVKWKLTEAAEADGLYWKNNEANATLDSIENVVYENLIATGKIKKATINENNFIWTLTEPTDDLNIDDINKGLPKKADILEGKEALDGDKPVYIQATVGEFTTNNYIKITVKKDTTAVTNPKVKPVLTKTEFTYGELITADDIKLVEENGKDVNASVKKILNAGTGTIKFTPVNANNVAVENGKICYNTLNTGTIGDARRDLAPGRYAVTFEEKAVAPSVDGVYDVIKNDTPVYITVAKKKVDKTMFQDINIKLVNKYAKVDAQTVNRAVDTGIREIVPDGIDIPGATLTVEVSGHDTANAVGTYEVTVKPNGEAANYYEGTTTIKWHAYDAAVEAELGYDLRHDDSQNNIYTLNGGVQLHFEVNKYADKDAKNPIDKASDKVIHYGLLYSKDGAFEKDAIKSDVERVFRLDNGYLNKDSIKNNSNGVTTGLNLSFTKPTDYAWVRPYSVVEGGAVVYGDAFMVDFESVAQGVVQPTMDKPDLVQRNGQLLYFTYGTRSFRDTEAGKKTAEPVDWGFVVDRTGNYTDDFDYENLTLDNCDATSTHALKSFEEDETAVLAKVTDSLSKVYLRAYVDFGNDMVVYYNLPEIKATDLVGEQISEYNNLTDDAAKKAYLRKVALEKVSCESASEKLAKAMDLKANCKVDKDVKRIAVIRNDAPNSITAHDTKTTKKGVELKFQPIAFNKGTDEKDAVTEFGLVIDKTGVYDKDTMLLTIDEGIAKKYKTVDAYKTNNTAAFGDFGLGENSDETKTLFSAVTSRTNKVAYRGYAIYKGIVVYTDVATENTVSST